ncbi:hypothetical protein ACXYTJ_15795 [Gilvimarinus sp. F26214L]|uniref:hypothetical protein n=1 Tax=Gilvimarinus sp. DZF01 TaxID=3461371 RepID=UPI00404578ED
MNDFFPALLNASVVVFAVSSMIAAGAGNRLADVLQPLRNLSALLRAIVANFVLVPLLAVVVLRLLDVSQPIAIGLFLVATAAGAPFLIKLAAVAATDLALSTTLLLVLLPVTIVYMPIVVPLALPAADVSAIAIARPLLLTMLVPLALGLLLRVYAEAWALRAQALLAMVSTLALVVLIVATVAANLSGILAVFRTSAIVAIVIVIGGAFVIGFLLGGPTVRGREVLGLGTSQRNIAAATVVATQAVGHPNTVTMVVVSSLVGFAILFPVAWLLSRTPAEPAGNENTSVGRRPDRE